jgi:DNA (cytosine-5)-methyltransferase 1
MHESPETWLARRERERTKGQNGNGMGMPLGIAAKLWPTPTVCGNYNRVGASATSGDGLATAAKNWPTPCSSDDRDRGHMDTPAVARRSLAGKQIMLSMAARSSAAPDPLNPAWVECLMGFPPGWTECEPADTAGRSRKASTSTRGSRLAPLEEYPTAPRD